MTTRINLLPWRQIKRKKENKKIIKLTLFGLILALLACFFIDFMILNLSEKQDNYNRLLKEEISKIDAKINEINRIKIEKQIMIKRMNLLQDLKNNRLLVVHLFAELTQLISDEIYLNVLEVSGMKIMLQGFSKSNLALSKLMKKIENNPWMKAPNLIEIKKEKNLDLSNHFTLSFILQNKKNNNENIQIK